MPPPRRQRPDRSDRPTLPARSDWEGPASDPDRYRRQIAAQQAEAAARRRAVAQVQEAPPELVAAERSARVARLVEPYTVDRPFVREEPGERLIVVLPGQVPLVNRIGERGVYNPETRKVYNPASEVRGDYAERVAVLCGLFHPLRLDAERERDLIVHHLVDLKRCRGNPPDAGAVRVAVKGALDGLTRSHNPAAYVLEHDRRVNEVMTVARPAAVDVLVLELRPSAGWPLPIVTVPAS